MKLHTLSIILAICFVSQQGFAQDSKPTNQNYQLLLQLLLPQYKPSENKVLVKHPYYTVFFDKEVKQARWVSHLVMPCECKLKRRGSFSEDENEGIKGFQVLKKTHYKPYNDSIKSIHGKKEYNLIYDVGHLAPYADFKWSLEAAKETNRFSNTAFQVASFNRWGWGPMEGRVRKYANKKQKTLAVITGLYFGDYKFDGVSIKSRWVKGEQVPTYFYKVLYDINSNQGIALLMPNIANDKIKAYKKKQGKGLASFAKSIDELEKILGIDFFANLDDNLEAEFESKFDSENWKIIVK